MKIAFVEEKQIDMARIAALLDRCAAQNHWANGGPVWQALRAEFILHLQLQPAVTVLPCANAGIALEAMARLWQQRLGRRLRWAVPAFAFRNLGRGWFSDGPVVDCDSDGMVDVAQLDALDPGSFDGIVAVNPLGHARDFTAVIGFARARGVPLLLDNAAGTGPGLPDWPWQALSLHHTKPYGMGEGGLAVIPDTALDDMQSLITYGTRPDPAGLWLNNGKISDIACAFLLDRLEQAPRWRAESEAQKARILALAAEVGLQPLAGGGRADVPLTSVVLLGTGEIAAESLRRVRHFVPAKYYQPIAPAPKAEALFRRLVNVPVHPTMARLDDAAILADLQRLVHGNP